MYNFKKLKIMVFVHKLTDKMIITRNTMETTSKVEMPDGQTYEIHNGNDTKYGVTVIRARNSNGQLATVNPKGKFKIGQQLPNIITTDEKVVNRDGEELSNLYWNAVKK
jgi:hypothetical protein